MATSKKAVMKTGYVGVSFNRDRTYIDETQFSSKLSDLEMIFFDNDTQSYKNPELVFEVHFSPKNIPEVKLAVDYTVEVK